MNRHLPTAWGFLILLMGGVTQAQLEFESAPVKYSLSTPDNPISRLQKRLEKGELKLSHSGDQSYLASLLNALEIPESSQMLVFSKTSLQLRRITPKRPRAIYFNDDTYIGWVQGGDVIEISTADPQLGGVFYTLSTEEQSTPKFIRDQGQCITCHASSRTEGVPGHLIRSAFVDRTGQPHYGSGTYSTTQSSPFNRRWGGWYVTGTHGDMRHMGNIISPKAVTTNNFDWESGANVLKLDELLDTSPYLQPTSDLVALMVMTHQLEMHNLITRASFEARNALHYNEVMNRALEREEDYVSDSTTRRISSVTEKLLNCMFFLDETPITAPIAGTSTFQSDFESTGRHDADGRSLRQLDLTHRLFKYPCSYLIYSEAFDALPLQVKVLLATRTLEVLQASDSDDDFPHLSAQDRANILSILKATKPEFLDLAVTNPEVELLSQ